MFEPDFNEALTSESRLDAEAMVTPLLSSMSWA